MKELLEYREKLIARLGEAAAEFCAACESFADPSTNVEGEWNVHQIAAHTRDGERFVYGARIRRTLSEDNPEFPSFNADHWMAEHYKADEPLASVLGEFSASIAGMCSALKEMPQEGWSRLSRHETLGSGLTLQLWVERSLAHIEEHLQSLKKVGIS
ncbi:MAG TPA: hypothetical protein DCY14_15855 [Anaerolineae bacterium]|nr:hypothetical protein [Anaerolineae bacterium]HRJ55615.1 DinB family protein [Anaerolineales bacterium]